MTKPDAARGPLAGIRVVEFAGIGPAPFACMLLADMGAQVVRLHRPGHDDPLGHRILNRSRTNVEVDLKAPQDLDRVMTLCASADVVVEGFRPGVLERLGLGPAVLHDANPALVIGRMTGWGQHGPWAQAAGHDINYIALTGALHAIGRRGQPPTVPLNLVGDFGGGSLFLVTGVLAALLRARTTGTGQVVDAAMVDGASTLMTMFHDLHQAGLHRLQRGSNLLDSGTWFYDVYECADGKHLAIGPLEDAFRDTLVDLLGLGSEFTSTNTTDASELRRRFAAHIATQPLAHWDSVLAGTDACYAPVLSLAEVATHPHMAARDVLIEVDGVLQPAPAPRFSDTPSPRPHPARRATMTDVIEQWQHPVSR